jgi:hypothetical protein
MSELRQRLDVYAALASTEDNDEVGEEVKGENRIKFRVKRGCSAQIMTVKAA